MTELEEKAAAEMYLDGKSSLKIAKIVGCSVSSILRLLKKKNITTRSDKLKDEDIENILDLYNNGLSITKITNKTKHCYGTIQKILKYNNIEIRGKGAYNKRKYCVDDDFFETIDTEAKAYWLGFITADGCICNNTVTISLSKKDHQHLEKFLKDINSDYKIRYKKTFLEKTNKTYDMCSVGVKSNKLCKDLKKLGVTSAKTFIVKPCNKIPNHLYHFYFLGLFDGDGSIFNYIEKKTNKEKWQINFCGNLNMVEAFKDFISPKINSSANIRKLKPKDVIYYIYYSGDYKLKQIIDILYKDATVFLDRKKKKADMFLEIKYDKLNKGVFV